MYGTYLTLCIGQAVCVSCAYLNIIKPTISVASKFNAFIDSTTGRVFFRCMKLFLFFLI